MKTFPRTLTPDNKDSFKAIVEDVWLSTMREHICRHILKGDENNFFDLDEFTQTHTKDTTITTKLSRVLIEELKALGWNCTVTFGGTGLFIYSTSTPPPSCWIGDF